MDRRFGSGRALLPLLVALGMTLALMLALPVASLATAPPAPASFTTAFVDDFNGAAGTSVSGTNWRFDTGQGIFGTGEIETMTSSTNNVFLDGQGRMHIRALKDGAGNWTSGRFESQRADFMPPAGGVMCVQSSLALPNVNGSNGLGYWPAFWMLGSPIRSGSTWPSVGELDIMESINAVASDFGTMHCGSKFFSINSTRVDATTWANATNHPYFILFDLAIGGGFPAAFGGGPTSATVSGGEMIVDYVAVYTKSGGGTSPTATPTPTSTPIVGGGDVSATSTIQAEAFNARSAQPRTETTTDTGGGLDVGWIGNGDWLQYNNVNFGSTPLRQFKARVASGAGSGVSGLVEVHLDSLNNPSIGSFAIGNTGGWQSWRTVPANMNATTGTHTVFLKFVTGSGQNFVNVNWFTFSP